MDLLIIILWLILAAAAVETVYGFIKHQGILTVIGICVTLMCILGLILAINYADSITIIGEGMPA